jgi:hypothetical protein
LVLLLDVTLKFSHPCQELSKLPRSFPVVTSFQLDTKSFMELALNTLLATLATQLLTMDFW